MAHQCEAPADTTDTVNLVHPTRIWTCNPWVSSIAIFNQYANWIKENKRAGPLTETEASKFQTGNFNQVRD